MEAFESQLTQATNLLSRDLLGAIGLVINNQGQILYHHAAGHQSLDDDAPPLDPDSTVALHSAGKLITHIAALQFVDRGIIELDEPVSRFLPEISSLPLITAGTGEEPFTLRPPAKEMTMRHLLLHASGLADDSVPIVSQYLASDVPKVPTMDSDDHTVKHFSLPLIFEPGEGFAYGASIHWLQLLVKRLSGGAKFGEHVYEHIFRPLGMSSSTYGPRGRPDIWERRLRMVCREGIRLVEDDDATQGLMCSVSDVGKLLGDLISSSPKLLKPESIRLLFKGQLSDTALQNLRENHDNYAFCAELSPSRLPTGTAVWDGMANTIWAMNRERGLAAFWAVQHLPYGDEKVNRLAMSFMRSVWATP